MKDISDLTVTQYRIYPAGKIPYRLLRVSAELRQRMAPFAFSSGSLDPSGDEIVLESGVYESLVIDRLQFNDRRIVVRLLGSSKAADRVSRALEDALTRPSGVEQPSELKPVLVFQESSCTVTLDFDTLSLLALPVSRLLKNDLLAAASNETGEASIAHLQFKVELTYRTKSELLERHKIALAPKMFVLEPMANTPFSERRFFTSSPTDSETHIRLIESFERAITQR